MRERPGLRRVRHTLRTNRQYVVFGLLAAAIVGNLGIYVVGAVRGLTSPFSFDYGEDFVLYLATNPELLYHPIDVEPYLPTVYPPIYPSVVGALHAATGGALNVFTVGRLTSIVAALGTTVLVGALSTDRDQVVPFVVAGGIFLANPTVSFWGVAARVDMLGLFFSVAALYWFIDRRGYERLVGAVVLCVLALYTKQSFIAAPLAIGASLLWERRWKETTAFGIGLGVTGLAVLAGLSMLTDGRAWNQLVVYQAGQSVRVMDTVWWGYRFAQRNAVLLALGAFASLFRHERVPTVVLGYVLIAGAVNTYLIGKQGSNWYYFLDLIAGLSVVAGILFSDLYARRDVAVPEKESLRPLVLVCLVLVAQLVLFAQPPLSAHPDGATAAADVVDDTDRPVLSVDASILMRNEQTVIYEPFIMTQLHQAGYWDQTPVLRSIANREYGYIVLSFDVSDRGSERYPDRWSEEQLRTIDANYELHGVTGSYWIYAPRNETRNRRAPSFDDGSGTLHERRPSGLTSGVGPSGSV